MLKYTLPSLEIKVITNCYIVKLNTQLFIKNETSHLIMSLTIKSLLNYLSNNQIDLLILSTSLIETSFTPPKPCSSMRINNNFAHYLQVQTSIKFLFEPYSEDGIEAE